MDAARDESLDVLGPLTEADENRLDKLLSEVRRYHHLSLIATGLSILLFSLKELPSATLSSVQVPPVHLAIGLFAACAAFGMAAHVLLAMAFPLLERSSRRVPFAWFALGGTRPRSVVAVGWVIAPPFVCALFIGLAVPGALMVLFQVLGWTSALATVTVLTGRRDESRLVGAARPRESGIGLAFAAIVLSSTGQVWVSLQDVFPHLKGDGRSAATAIAQAMLFVLSFLIALAAAVVRAREKRRRNRER